MLYVRLLGGFGLRWDGVVVQPDAWRLRKAATLVKYLALAPGFRLPREVILDRLWPHLAPVAAENNLRQTLHAARRPLAAAAGPLARLLRLVDDALVLGTADHLHVDVVEFEHAAARARAERSRETYAEALARYRGELLPDDLYDDVISERRDELRAAYLDLLVGLATLEENAAGFLPALAHLEAALDVDPLNEVTHAARVRLLNRLGREAEAALADRRFSARLAQELSGGAGQPEVAAQPRSNALDHRPRRKTNLVPLRTSFIGRETEMAALVDGLQHRRLITLIGPGGIGKSRLAREVALLVAPAQLDGAWLVELAGIDQGSAVAGHVAATLDVRDGIEVDALSGLVAWAMEREFLLVLDNCEHLLEPCALLANVLLDRAPGMRILATSRERLRVPGEEVSVVSPLAVGTGLPAQEAARSDAVRLFVDRAREVVPSFSSEGALGVAVATVCARLDGLPLAIELAAGWTATLSLDAIAARMDRPDFPSTTSPFVEARHRSVRDTCDWSYQLLSEPERACLARVSVFRGGWIADAAEAVVTDQIVPTDDLPRLLRSLAEKSLVQSELTAAGPRFGMLETIRGYAREQLVRRDEDVAFSRRHVAYFVDRAIAADAGLTTAELESWMATLRREPENFSAALAWSLGNRDWGTALELGRHLWMFWSASGQLSEGRRWLGRILAEVPDTPSEARADVLNGAGALARQQDDYEASLWLHHQGLAMQREIGDDRGAGFSLNNLGLLQADRGNFEEAIEFYREGLEIFERRGDSWSSAAAHLNLGRLARSQGDTALARREVETARLLQRQNGDERGVAYSLQQLAAFDVEDDEVGEAERKLQDAVAILERLGDRQGVAYCDRLLGSVALRRRDRAGAASRWRQALAGFDELGDRQGLAGVFEDIAMLAAQNGDDRVACEVAAGAEQLRRRIGSPLPPHERRRLGAWRARLTRRLGADATRAWWTEGSALALRDIVSRARTALDVAVS